MGGRGKAQRSLDLIDALIEIYREIHPASVRAGAYQAFIRKLIPNMGKSATNGVSRLLVYAREAGLIPWEWIVDEKRQVERAGTWNSAEHFARAIVQPLRYDRWQDQAQRVEIWSEKGTVRGTLDPIREEFGVDVRVLHGYSSATVVQDVAALTKRMAAPLIVFYVGDRDPSGLHMSEVDLPRRLREYGAQVQLVRFALTPAEILAHDLPSFPAADKADTADKKGDSRYRWYVDNRLGDVGPHRAQCWELDALKPTQLRDLLRQAIRGCITNMDSWDRYELVEKTEYASLVETINKWPALVAHA